MRDLTMDEVGFVSGGVNPAGGWDNPESRDINSLTFYDGFRGPSDGSELSLWGDFKSAVSKAFGNFLKDLGISTGGHISEPDGEGPCLDAHGAVIRNADGSPLLKCKTTTGHFYFRFGS